MKKIFSVTLFFLLGASAVMAQKFDEWFKQDKTQIKYLLNQIAAYAVNLQYTVQGYQIAQDGLDSIGGANKQEFDLHTTYFQSLKTVNKPVAVYPRISAILAYGSAIISGFRKILLTKNMNGPELNYLNTVYNHMITDCNASLDALQLVITDDQYSMKDEQRLARIDALYRIMKDRYAFVQYFLSGTLLLAAERSGEQAEIGESILNNGLQ